MKICTICKRSEKDTRIIFFKGKEYLCNSHRIQKTRFGITYRTRYEKNNIAKIKDVALIDTYDINGNKIGQFKIDYKNVPKIKNIKWFKDRNGYAMAHINKKRLFLHHFLKGREKGKVIDHINGDRSDNREINLRIVSMSENNLNRKELAGVVFERSSNKWVAYIEYKTVRYWLGRFNNKIDAINARAEKEIELLGRNSNGTLKALKEYEKNTSKI